MGGMDELIGNEGTVQTEPSLVTRENLGDLLMLGYSDFLRRWDAAQRVAGIVRNVANSYRKDAIESISEALEGDWLNLDHKNLDRSKFSSEEISGNAALSVACEGLAEFLKTNVGRASSNFVEDKERELKMLWHTGRKVEVTSTRPKEESAMYTMFRNPKLKIIGTITQVELDPSRGGILQIQGSHIPGFGGYRSRTVVPLIDRDKNYEATVSLKYLED